MQPASYMLARSREQGSVLKRVVRNATWLVVGGGSTRVVRFVTQAMLARYLGTEGLGTLALAQSSATYATVAADLGVGMYGQGEAARREPQQVPSLLEEIAPARGLLGAAVSIVFISVSWVRISDPAVREVFCGAGAYILTQALRLDWLYRGRERFDLVVAAQAVECVCFFALVFSVGARPGALALDAVGWSLSDAAMAVVCFALLPGMMTRRISMRPRFGDWFGHVRESLFIVLSSLLNSAVWFGPLWLLAYWGSRAEVGLLAAPYSFVMSGMNLAATVPFAFFPVSAGLYHDQRRQFSESRRAMVVGMLILWCPLAIMASTVAQDVMSLVFGPAFRLSGAPFAILVWLVPLRCVRSIYGTTLIATGLQRLHPVGPAVGLVAAMLVCFRLVPSLHATGAAITILVAEVAGLAVTILVSGAAQGDASIPGTRTLGLVAVLNLGLALLGVALTPRLGALGFLIAGSLLYPLGVFALGLLPLPWLKNPANDLD